MDDLLTEFLTETSESMDTLDVELVKLEQNPNDPELLSNIFRLVHTVKGTCGFLGLPRLEAVAHASENVLGKVRDGELEVTPQAISLVLESLDQIKAICGELEANEAEPDGDDAELIGQLNALANGEGAPVPKVEAEPEAAPAEAVAEAAPEDGAEAAGDGPPVSDEGFPVAAELLEEVAAAADPGAADAPADEPVAETAEAVEEPAVEAAAEAEPVEEPAPEAAPEPAPEAAPEPAAASADKPKSAPRDVAVAAQSIRVNVDVLENLMTMVSELVLSRNQLMQIHRAHENTDDFAAPLQTLNHIVSELQEGVMQTRMQPIGNAWAKLPRIVRDLSLELGKKIELRMIGQDTELDRQVLELIRDPLTHMVRNSADHAIEDPETRRKAGKSEVGTVTLNAYHEGGHIIIEIRDDGAGLNPEKLKAKILANELATEAEIEGLSDSQIFQYIFKAGFSTAAKVTSVSGRGVGMDVVRTNIEKIGGSIELQSQFGQGTVFTIKIPLTLAIVSALIVECGGEKFAIPQLSVLELVRASSTSDVRIEEINGAPVLRLRDRLLPLVSLRDQLNLGDEPEVGQHGVADKPAAEAVAGEETTDGEGPAESAQAAELTVTNDIGDGFIVVTQVGTQTFGIIVDRVFDTEEIVVKPVAPILRDIQLFSGNTILGDGSVIMILDPNGIAAGSGEMALSEATDDAADATFDDRAGERVAMLVFHAVNESPKAVPLGLVARLEEIEVEQIEETNGQMLVQYRGQLMPVISFDPSQQIRESGRQPMLVFTDGARSMGLVVDQIIDIVETELSVEIASGRPGIIGSAVIAGKATDVIDTGHYLTQAFPDWFQAQGNNEDGTAHVRRVLLVDDSAFFRNMITPLLEVAGYKVTTVDSASAALALCERGLSFDAIVSDIEMPGMSGFEFAEKVKSEGAWKEIPILALSSRTSPSDLDRGREVGFSDYVGKFDRDALLTSLSQTLALQGGAA